MITLMLVVGISKFKKKLNKKNFTLLEKNYLNGNKNRPRNIDLTTLLDESGIIILTKNSYLASLIRQKKWKTVFGITEI